MNSQTIPEKNKNINANADSMKDPGAVGKLVSKIRNLYEKYMDMESSFSETEESECSKKCEESHDVYLRFEDEDRGNKEAKLKQRSFWRWLANTLDTNEYLIYNHKTFEDSEETSTEWGDFEEDAEYQLTQAVLEYMIHRGLDQAALAISPRYPLKPKACVCRECCCNCLLYSPYIDKLNLPQLKAKYNKRKTKINSSNTETRRWRI